MAVVKKRPVLTLEISPLLDDQWTGIPIFTRRLLTSLLQSDKVDLRFCAGLAAIPTERVLSAVRLATGAFLREELQRERSEEVTLPDVAAPLLFPSVKPVCGLWNREASTVHDMSTLFMPENHKRDNVAHHLDNFVDELASNEVTFCVSEATEAALTAAFPSVKGRTSILYQYVDWPEDFEVLDYNLPRIRLGRYAAVIGTIEPRKNLGLLLRALALPELRDSDMQFVVIGRKGWLVDEFMEGVPPDVRSRIVFSGFVSEFSKYRLLKHCEFLVFPSIYEGFGIPALEALSLGKPVLAARTSSFPEVIGDCGVYFDPLSPEEFAVAFAELDQPDRIAHLGQRASSRCKAFSAERMAQPVLSWLRRR
jgi:glycosyltransferase involved in cell wall biosynthesis